MIGRPTGPALLLGAVVVVVSLVLGVALLVLDSPADARRERLDRRRVDDLVTVADVVDAYWKSERSLPPDFDTLDGWEGFDLSRTDPVSGDPYTYRPTGSRTYELCATFATEDPGQENPPRWRRHGIVWHHPAGEHCFALEVEE